MFNKKIKDYLEGENIEENAFRKLIKEGKIYSFYYDGVWLTVNDKNELKKAEEFVKDFDVLNIKNSKNLEFGGSKEKEVIEKIRNVLNELVK